MDNLGFQYMGIAGNMFLSTLKALTAQESTPSSGITLSGIVLMLSAGEMYHRCSLLPSTKLGLSLKSSLEPPKEGVGKGSSILTWIVAHLDSADIPGILGKGVGHTVNRKSPVKKWGKSYHH